MRQITKHVVRRISILIVVATTASVVTATNARCEIIFESGTLGPTAVPWSDLTTSVVPSTNVNEFVFPGVRVHFSKPVITTQIGGHFVGPSGGEFFGALIALHDENDFPDSIDFTSADVLGSTLLAFPTLSDEVFGDLDLSLDPGWYAMVFGSGHFGATSYGGAVRNGLDIGSQSYISFDPNIGWFNFDIFGTHFDNHRFVIHGRIVPEPTALALMSIAFLSSLLLGILNRR